MLRIRKSWREVKELRRCGIKRGMSTEHKEEIRNTPYYQDDFDESNDRNEGSLEFTSQDTKRNKGIKMSQLIRLQWTRKWLYK